jgi:hypothetical protein
MSTTALKRRPFKTGERVAIRGSRLPDAQEKLDAAKRVLYGVTLVVAARNVTDRRLAVLMYDHLEVPDEEFIIVSMESPPKTVDVVDQLVNVAGAFPVIAGHRCPPLEDREAGRLRKACIGEATIKEEPDFTSRVDGRWAGKRLEVDARVPELRKQAFGVGFDRRVP